MLTSSNPAEETKQLAAVSANGRLATMAIHEGEAEKEATVQPADDDEEEDEDGEESEAEEEEGDDDGDETG
eukprot:2533883-Heterocapsa_arctica.AAC.1